MAISTVGPYLRYGEALVAACADAGTDYADLTGETEFLDRMYLRYHERAKQSAASQQVVGTGHRSFHATERGPRSLQPSMKPR